MRTHPPGPHKLKPRARSMTPALKILRVKMGLTIQDVSDRMGIAVSNVWRIEEGKNLDAAAILAYVRAISL